MPLIIPPETELGRVILESPCLSIRLHSIYPTFIGFQNCIKILINKDTLLVSVNALLSHYLYYSLNKESLQRYCSTGYSRSGVNRMWILKNLKELLETLMSHDFSKIDSIKTYDFSTLYTIIPHNKLKSQLFQIHILWDTILIANTSTLKKTLRYAWLSCRQYLHVCSLWRPGLPTILVHSYGR
jgi:hypothetical protein